jgi:hypothetical protein
MSSESRTAGLGGLLEFDSSSNSADTTTNNDNNGGTINDNSDTFSFSFNNVFTRELPVPTFPLKPRSQKLYQPRANILDASFALSPSRIAQSAMDLAWRTILASVVNVEGVGDVGVATVLHEIWKRGGGDTVSRTIAKTSNIR